MDINKLSRKEKEDLYIKKMTELQTLWKNPIDDDWDFNEWSDEQLNKGLEDTIGQLRFEKTILFFFKTVKIVFSIIILLGIIGLLKFGLNQLF